MISRTVPYLPSADPSAMLSAIEQRPPQQTGVPIDKLLDTYQRADNSIATRFDMPAETVPVNENDQKFRELLHQFVGQTLFGQMLKSMRATQEKNPYFHGGRAEEIFQGQLDMVLGDQLTKASSKTLSEPMYKLMKAPKS